MKIFKRVIWLCFFVASVIVLWLNLRLHTENHTKQERREDILLQFHFLEKELKQSNLGQRMQAVFPEGFVFSNALYGLAWCELALDDATGQTKAKAIEEAKYAYEQINSEAGRSIFDPNLVPAYGAFYLGWNNYLLSKWLQIDTTAPDRDHYEKVYQRQSAYLAELVAKNAGSPFFQSYVNECWPADMCVAMASLANYERVFDGRYKHVVSGWVEHITPKMDPYTGLLPHKVHATDGSVMEGARGCSISLIIRFLSEIDSGFAQQQYRLYKQNFIANTLTLPSVKEYPKGKSGSGDIDSGPVIMGVGFAGTIVAIGTHSVMGDWALSEQQYRTIHSFGVGLGTGNGKSYAFGELPIADAFIAWGRSSALSAFDEQETLGYWAGWFHLGSLGFVLLLWGIWYYIHPRT
jgi:hypothetical protein